MRILLIIALFIGLISVSYTKADEFPKYYTMYRCDVVDSSFFHSLNAALKETELANKKIFNYIEIYFYDTAGCSFDKPIDINHLDSLYFSLVSGFCPVYYLADLNFANYDGRNFVSDSSALGWLMENPKPEIMKNELSLWRKRLKKSAIYYHELFLWYPKSRHVRHVEKTPDLGQIYWRIFE